MHSINYLNKQIKDLNTSYILVSEIFKNYLSLLNPDKNPNICDSYLSAYYSIYQKLKNEYITINMKIGMLKKLTSIYERMAGIRDFTHSEIEDFMINVSLIKDLINLLILDLDIEREYLINRILSVNTNYEIRRQFEYILKSISIRQKKIIAHIYDNVDRNRMQKKRKMSFDIATVEEYYSYPMKKMKVRH